MTSGEVWIVPWTNGRTWGLIDKGLPLGFVLPKEGGYAGCHHDRRGQGDAAP